MNILSLALSMTFLLNPANVGISLSQSGDYEGAEVILKSVPEAQRDARYYFFRTLDAYQLNHKQDVLGFADDVLYPNFMKTPEIVPMRYLVVANLMKEDAEHWKASPEELESLARDMKDVSKRLDVGKGGGDTQHKQKDILARLDKHIKDLEDELKKKNSSGTPNINGEARKPADDSVASQPEKKSSVTGDIDQKKLKATAEVWGKLNEKQRADAMTDLVKTLDPQTREVVERYFKELSQREESVAP